MTTINSIMKYIKNPITHIVILILTAFIISRLSILPENAKVSDLLNLVSILAFMGAAFVFIKSMYSAEKEANNTDISIYSNRGILSPYSTRPTSYSPLDKEILEAVVVHELGHAFVVMLFPSLYEKTFLRILTRDIESLNQGYIFYRFNEAVQQNSKDILDLKMLILLAGMQAEKHYFSGKSHMNGARSDLALWLDLAKIYIQHEDDNIYYIHPQNQFESDHNTSLLLNLKNSQIAILADFFNANEKLFNSLVEKTMEQGTITFQEMNLLAKDIVTVANLPFEYKETHPYDAGA